MKNTWTNTIDAIKRGERHQWAIGDALEKDVSAGPALSDENPPFDG